MTDRPLNDFETRTLDNIATHGWSALHVFDPDGLGAEFSYSVGFTRTLGAPEFIVFGLPKDLRHYMLSEVFRQIKAGCTAAPGQRWHNLIEGFDCVGMAATDPELFTEYATSANWFWRHQGHTGHPDVIQLVWPGSKDGLFPWDDGCSPDVIAAQPRLWA